MVFIFLVTGGCSWFRGEPSAYTPLDREPRELFSHRTTGVVQDSKVGKEIQAVHRYGASTRGSLTRAHDPCSVSERAQAWTHFATLQLSEGDSLR